MTQRATAFKEAGGFLTALAGALAVKPGFVASPITVHLKEGLLFASPERIARGIASAIEKRKRVRLASKRGHCPRSDRIHHLGSITIGRIQHENGKQSEVRRQG